MNKQTIFSALKALAITAVAAAVMLLVFCFVALKTDDPAAPLRMFAYIALFACAFVCGFSFSKFNRENGLVGGALCGALFAIVIFIGSVVRNDGTNLHVLRNILICAGLVAFSAAGGFLGLPREKSAKSRMKSLRRRAGQR